MHVCVCFNADIHDNSVNRLSCVFHEIWQFSFRVEVNELSSKKKKFHLAVFSGVDLVHCCVCCVCMWCGVCASDTVFALGL